MELPGQEENPTLAAFRTRKRQAEDNLMSRHGRVPAYRHTTLQQSRIFPDLVGSDSERNKTKAGDTSIYVFVAAAVLRYSCATGLSIEWLELTAATCCCERLYRTAVWLTQRTVLSR